MTLCRVAEKSPYTGQYATIIWFESLSMPWLHVYCIHICTLMLDTQTDAPPCPLWHTSEHFWSNCAKGVFHSSAKVFVVVVAMHSHSSLDNTPQRIVWYGKVRTAWWSWQWCRWCWWATANQAAWKTFVQNIAHRKSEVCRCPIVLQPHVIQESFVSKLRYEPCLQHCPIRCPIHRSIEKLRSNQIIWCHTHPYHHMWWIMFQLLREIGILLWPEHHISVVCTAIDGTFVTEKNLCAGYGIWECVQQSTAWFIAPIHVAIWQLGNTASHSSLSTCGLALLTVAHQALTIVSVSTSLKNIQ